MSLAFGITAWLMLAVFLMAGLFIYERTGLRLGGVLVLPLLLVYALFDFNILIVFGISALVTLWIGTAVFRRSLLYGRRLLYVFLVVGILATLGARLFIQTEMEGFVLAILPGLFAYNLHREGDYVAGASAFLFWFGILMMAAIAGFWVLTSDGSVARAFQGMVPGGVVGTAAVGLSDGVTGFVGDMVAGVSPWAAEVAGKATSVHVLQMAVGSAPGIPDGALMTGGGGAAFVQSFQMGEGGE
jgi:hypothetical protein